MSLVAPFAQVEADIASANMAMLANVVVSTANGVEFLAEFDEVDRTAFEVVQVGDYVLRFMGAAAALVIDETVVINGASYRVAEHPRRVSGHEMVVGLSLERP